MLLLVNRNKAMLVFQDFTIQFLHIEQAVIRV